jgi:aryl-alcohol dehydrogenase-like predicted oxidoreductase
MVREPIQAGTVPVARPCRARTITCTRVLSIEEGVMEERYVGRTGLRVSRLGLGTMTWGRDTDEHEAADQLRDFVTAGGTLVETGAGYGSGAAEELLGQLLGHLVAREDLVLAARPESGSSRRGMLDALDATLDRLGTDHLDLWLAPGWDPHVPVEETASALEYAVTSGRARYTGVADHCGWQTALAVARGGAWGPVAVQAEYSLVQRGVEREVLPAAEALGLGLLAWSPLGRGVLTGKYRTGTPADSRAASPHLSGFVGPYLGRGSRRVVDAVVTAADGLGCEPLEVALAWARDRADVAAVLVGARTAAQLRGSLLSEDVELPPEIRAALDEVSAPPLGYPERSGGR